MGDGSWEVAPLGSASRSEGERSTTCTSEGGREEDSLGLEAKSTTSGTAPDRREAEVADGKRGVD